MNDRLTNYLEENKLYVTEHMKHIHIRVRELCELRDHVNTCDIVSANMIHVLLGELCIE